MHRRQNGRWRPLHRRRGYVVAIALLIQNRPTLFEHVNALGVFLLYLAVVVALIQKPEHLEVDCIEQTISDLRFEGGAGIKNNLAGLKTSEMNVDHLAE